VRGSGRDYEVIVFERAVGDDNAMFGEIDVLHFGEEYLNVVVSGKDLADGNGDLRGRNECGGHLIKKRLECVVVLAVDESDMNGSVAECLGGEQTTKAAADDDYMRCV
jgi:hypothetical protein